MSEGALVRCPRCHVGLHVGTTRAGTIHGCGRCGGVWLDRAMSQRLTQALDSDTLALADAAARHAPAPLENPGAAIGCPRCGATLARHQVANARVELDSCSTHGTWFDRNELQKVARCFAASRAYGAPALAGGAALGTVAVGAAGLANAADGQTQQRMQQMEEGSVSAVEIGGEVLEAGVDLAESAGDIAEVGGGALEVAGAAFEIVGGIFGALG